MQGGIQWPDESHTFLRRAPLCDLEQQLYVFTLNYVRPGLPRTKGTRVARVRRIPGDPSASVAACLLQLALTFFSPGTVKVPTSSANA
jgi:hypothetical protein